VTKLAFGRFERAAFFVTAALACLQPGIDPVFLTLLSAAHQMDSSSHALIVGATQTGMALGALAVWRLGGLMPRRSLPAAALIALAASLATARFGNASVLIALRTLYGFAMGIIYTHAMSMGAALRPTGAYGAVFLIQLIISTSAALVLPMVAEMASPGIALAALALAPLLTLLTVSFLEEGEALAALPAQRQSASARHECVPPWGWALAFSSFFFICATMMVWSFTGALAMHAGLDEEAIGLAVAVGSIAGALTATAMLREKPLVPLPLSGALAGFSLLAPIVLTQPGQDTMFILSVILLNIGSTAIIIRSSGAAAAASLDPLFRRLVACAHPVGMIMGPAIGSAMTMAAGDHGLLIGAVCAIAAGCLALVFSALSQRTIFRASAEFEPTEPDVALGNEAIV